MNDEAKVKRSKKLRGEITIIASEENSLRSRAANLRLEADNKRAHLKELQKELNSLNENGGIVLTEHAILRYLERVKGLNIEEIQKEIVTPHLINMVQTLGESGHYPCKGFKVVIKDRKVVTVI